MAIPTVSFVKSFWRFCVFAIPQTIFLSCLEQKNAAFVSQPELKLALDQRTTELRSIVAPKTTELPTDRGKTAATAPSDSKPISAAAPASTTLSETKGQIVQGIPTSPSTVALPNQHVNIKNPSAMDAPKKMAPVAITTTSLSEINLEIQSDKKIRQKFGTVMDSENRSIKGTKRKHDVLGDKERLLGMISEASPKQDPKLSKLAKLSGRQRQEMQRACEKSSLLQSMPPEYCSCDVGEFGEQICQLSVLN